MSRKRAAGDLRDGEAARPRTISEIMMDSTAGEPVSAGSLAELEREPVAVEEVAVAEKAVARREGVSVRVVDGRIVIDEASLQFDEAAEEAIGNSRQVLQETRFSKRRAKERKKATWNSRDTERFYLGLRRYGTDFTLMTTLFPEKSRRDLLLKFKKEEREHPDEVDYALMHPLPVDSVDLQDSLLRMQSSDLAAEIAQSQLEDIPPSAQQTVLDHQEQLAELEEIFPNPDVGNRADEFSTR